MIILLTFIVYIHILYTVAYFMHCMISLTMPLLDLIMSTCLSLSITPCFLSMLAALVRSSSTRRQPGVDNVRHGEHLLGQLQLPVKLGP